MNITLLHESARRLALQYRQTEAQLLEVLAQLDGARAFGALGYPSCFDYCLKGLGLSEAQSYYFSRVARKSLEVPELKAAVVSGTLTLSQARRIVPVVDRHNVGLWVEKAAQPPQRQLEREVAAENPQTAPLERVRPLSSGVLELKVAISPKTEALLRRLKDLKPLATTDELLSEALEQLLLKRDPVQRATRGRTMQRPSRSGARRIPAVVAHAVSRRDQGRCQAVLPNGERCLRSRFVHIHHKTPWAHGGTHVPENLVSLCSAHHRAHHEFPQETETPPNAPHLAQA